LTTYVTAVYGALVVMSALAGVFFLRHWRSSRDGLFAWFAGAFLTFGASWALLARAVAVSEHTSYIYAVRLLGFLQILVAIAIKNRRTRD
jgi:hypothetical protein